MPRTPRLELPDGFVHVTSRGNRREAIFRDPRDHQCFLDHLGDAAHRFDWRVLGYCLMPNHVHLVVDAPRTAISRGMHRLSGSYAQWFNSRYDVVGHLFQGRFHATAIVTEQHLLQAARYTVLNPVRARLCRRAAEWPWSSYRATVGAGARPPFLDVDWVLAQFALDRHRARSAFRAFVSAGIDSNGRGPTGPGRGTVPGTWPD